MQAMLLLAVLAALLPLHHCVSPTEPTFNDIKAQCQPVPGSATPQCAKGQWVITLELGDKNSPDAWTPLYAGNATVPLGTCSSPDMGACFGPGKPLGDPIQVLSTRELKVTYTWKSIYNSMVLFNLTTMVPSQLRFKLCYSDVAFAGRAWRKQNKPYPRLTQNCMFSVKDISVPASINTSSLTQADKDSLSGTFVYEFDDDTMPSATLFMMMWVECSDARVCAFESLESPSYSVPSQGILEYPPQYVSSNPAPYNVPGPYNGTYIQVQGYNPITPGMTAGAIVLSIFGPVFFICYFIADHISYTRTGKALAW